MVHVLFSFIQKIPRFKVERAEILVKDGHKLIEESGGFSSHKISQKCNISLIDKPTADYTHQATHYKVLNK